MEGVLHGTVGVKLAGPGRSGMPQPGAGARSSLHEAGHVSEAAGWA